MANNMIVDEEYIKAEAENIKTIFLKMDSIVDRYIQILNTLPMTAIQDGEMSEALMVYIVFAKKLQGNLDEIGNSVGKLLENYLADIDEADQYFRRNNLSG